MRRIISSLAFLSLLTGTLSGDTLSLGYDAENQLTRASTDSRRVDYTYDENGNRTAVSLSTIGAFVAYVSEPGLWSLSTTPGALTLSLSMQAGAQTTGFRLEVGSGGVFDRSSPSISVSPGDSGELTLTVTGLDAGTVYDFRLVEETAGGDVLHGDGQAMTGFAEVADLAITRSAIPSAVNSGSVLDYTISVTNLGDERARLVAIGEQVRGSLVIESFASLAGTIEQVDSGQLHWSPGDLDPGATVELTVQAVATTEGLGSLSAIVETGSLDPDSGNNEAADRLSVTGGSGLPS
jgi:YD repeat-containing protein